MKFKSTNECDDIESRNVMLAKKLRKKLGKMFLKKLRLILGFQSKHDFNEMLGSVTDAVANTNDWDPKTWYQRQESPWKDIWERWPSPMQRYTICFIAASLIRPKPSDQDLY